MVEEWKPVLGFEDFYEVSSWGRLYSIRFNKIMADCTSSNGYIRDCLRGERISKSFSRHRIVAMAFLDNPENKPTVNHINADKTDNSVYNLEWATWSENNAHAHKLGLNKSPKSTPISQFDKQGNLINSWPTLASAASYYGISHSAISNNISGKSRYCRGFVWKYA